MSNSDFDQIKAKQAMTAYLAAAAAERPAHPGTRFTKIKKPQRGYERCDCGSGKQFKNCCK